jgi:hypothetical protein
MPWGVAAAVGASVVGSAISGSASESAANTQANAQQQAAADQLQMFNTINQQEQPFMNAGYGATGTLSQLLGLTPGNVGTLPNGYLLQTGLQPFSASEVTNSPGYQFAQSQGLQQVANAESANVGALSGPALKALTNYASGTAAQYYNDYFNQYNTQFQQGQEAQNNIFSRLSAIAGLGQNAASNTGNAGAQLGAGAAQATAAAGASQAAGTVGAGNAIAGGLNSAGSYLALNSILSGGGGNGYTNPGGVPGWTPSTGGS